MTKSKDLNIQNETKDFTPYNPCITIITVVYNGVDHIEATIKSVINQTYKNLEYIIIDGGSNDGTLQIIKKYQDKISSWISERDKGIYDAMNKGIDKASGEWINFMNSGDRFASNDVMSNVVKTLSNKIDVLYGNALIEYPGFNALFKIHPIEALWKHSPFCHQAAFIRTPILKEYRFDLSYKIGGDHDLFFRLRNTNKKFCYINELICLFDGKDGTTKNRITLAIRDKKNIALKYEYSLGKWLYYFIYQIYLSILLTLKSLLGPNVTRIITKKLKG